MIAKWPMDERFVITTPLAKREPHSMLAPKRSNQELVSFA
jgi:hypothetical protein